jgi:pyruvate carboxylase
MYKSVNDMLGDIIKVTPSSKMVGDLAIFMVQNNLTPEIIREKGANLAYPDSVVSFCKGLMGQPEGGIPQWFQKIVLKDEKPIDGRPGALLPPVDWDTIKDEVHQFYPDAKDDTVFISYAMYPKVFEEYVRHRKEYGYIMRMGSHVFFNGMAVGEVNKINIEDGKTLVIKYLGLGDLNEDGTRNVFFELNGMRREVAVVDPNAKDSGTTVAMADPNDQHHVGASIPGMISRVDVQPGDEVDANQVLAVVEAMKMETSIVAPRAGVIDQVLIKKGDTVKAGELLITLK